MWGNFLCGLGMTIRIPATLQAHAALLLVQRAIRTAGLAEIFHPFPFFFPFLPFFITLT
jgi:hypothetical protein